MLVELFERVAQEECWRPGDALARWPERSVYFALEKEESLAGGLQVVLPASRLEPNTLPFQLVWPDVEPPPRSAHIAILALLRSYRGQEDGMLFWRLAVEMWRWCVGEGIATLYIEVTPRVLPIYQRLGWPLEIVGEKRLHWGEDCYLCTLGIPEVAESLLRRAEHSGYYHRIIAQAFRVALPAYPDRVQEAPAVYCAAG